MEIDTDNIILVDKPVGISSFDVIRRLRKKLGIRKMGHGGTLDPLASGLMLIGVEKGTKKLAELLKLSKVYETKVLLGRSTTTGDLEGETVEEVKTSDEKLTRLDQDMVEATLQGMIGVHQVQVPLYSAIKVDGKALYKYAREGKVPPRIPIKDMEVLDIQRIIFAQSESGYPEVSFAIGVASGTYIRTIGEELGRRLGVPAVLSHLRRISIGDYDVADAITLDD